MNKTEKKMTDNIGKCLDLILDGTMLAIDPGSNSLGYAIYKAGELEISGEIKGKGLAHERLHEIADQLLELEKPDVLAIELIRKNHVLIWSIGTTIACIRSPNLIEVPITLWHKLRADDYEKTDALDAELIGQVVISRAKILRKWK
jgi:hypothetical protein